MGDETLNKKSKKSSSFFIVGIIVFLALAVTVLSYVYNNYKATKSEAGKSDAITTFIPLPEIQVELFDSPAKKRRYFLVAGLVLQASTQKSAAILEERMPLIRDHLYQWFSAIDAQNFTSTEGTNLSSPLSLEVMRAQMIRRVNTVVAPYKVENVLYSKFIISEK